MVIYGQCLPVPVPVATSATIRPHHPAMRALRTTRPWGLPLALALALAGWTIVMTGIGTDDTPLRLAQEHLPHPRQRTHNWHPQARPVLIAILPPAQVLALALSVPLALADLCPPQIVCWPPVTARPSRRPHPATVAVVAEAGAVQGQ